MVKAVTLLLLFQLIGETITRAFGLPAPGPVLGMGLLLCVLLVRGTLVDWIGKTAEGLLKHLSLLFVPASVGLIQHVDRIEAEWIPIGLALLASTIAAIAVGAATFVVVARWTGHRASGVERKGDGG